MIYVKDRITLLAETLPPQAIVAEIGCRRAEFAVQIMELPIRKLYCCDSWAPIAGPDGATQDEQDWNLKEAQWNLRGHIPGGRVEIVRGWSADLSKNWSREKLDAVYVDADHSYEAVLADLHGWSKLLTDRGSIYGHDFTANGLAQKLNFGVIEAVKQFCKETDFGITHLTREDFASYRLQRL